MKLEKAKSINGESILEKHESSEHTSYNGKYYGYVCITTESRKWFIPMDLKDNLVLNTNIWGFINEVPTSIE